MNRIIALNEDTDSESDGEGNVQVTKEAEVNLTVQKHVCESYPITRSRTFLPG